MPGACVNPDELLRFARLLDETVSSIRQGNSSLNSSYNSLKGVWHDKKYQQFDKIYSQTLPQIERFCKSAEQYSKYLRDKEKPLRRYLKQNY